jgi:dihydroxy-acid dehydratase
MVRISDARMSGTVVLHVIPEVSVGGPLALVRTGDRIALSASRKRIDLLVAEDELARRRASLPSPAAQPDRGFGLLYERSVLPATDGCDFDFLQPPRLLTLR